MMLHGFAVAALIACLGAVGPVGPVAADSLTEPSPSCPKLFWPSGAAAVSPPGVATWTGTDFPHELAPCVQWDVQKFTAFAALTGTFKAAGMDEVLSRIGAISTYKGMRYWSVMDQRLEPLIKDAFAIEGSPPNITRPDFTPRDMQVGRQLIFSELDNRSSDPVLYRMTIIERSPNRLVVDIANTTKVRRFLLTLFEPGDLRTALIISRSADGIWTCYAVSGFHPTKLTEVLDSHKSQANRLIALYGHIADSDDNELPWAK